MRSEWASSHVYPCIPTTNGAWTPCSASMHGLTWTNHVGTMFWKTTAPPAGEHHNLTSARPLPYANIWTGYTPLIPEQLCSFIHTSEMKCLAPAGRMTPEDSLTITVNVRQNFPWLKTKEKINACQGTLNALKWVCFLFTCTFELYCTILHGLCSTGMASWWFIQQKFLTLFSFTTFRLVYSTKHLLHVIQCILVTFNKCMKWNVNTDSGCMLNAWCKDVSSSPNSSFLKSPWKKNVLNYR